MRPKPPPPQPEVTTLWEGANVELQSVSGVLHLVVHEDPQLRRRGRLTRDEAARLGAVLTNQAGSR